MSLQPPCPRSNLTREIEPRTQDRVAEIGLCAPRDWRTGSRWNKPPMPNDYFYYYYIFFVPMVLRWNQRPTLEQWWARQGSFHFVGWGVVGKGAGFSTHGHTHVLSPPFFLAFYVMLRSGTSRTFVAYGRKSWNFKSWFVLVSIMNIYEHHHLGPSTRWHINVHYVFYNCIRDLLDCMMRVSGHQHEVYSVLHHNRTGTKPNLQTPRVAGQWCRQW